MSDQIKRGDRVILARVSLSVIIPNGAATEQQISDWLRFHLSQSGMLRNDNPLSDQEPEVVASSIRWDVVRAGTLG
jgi:hypothetical protein